MFRLNLHWRLNCKIKKKYEGKSSIFQIQVAVKGLQGTKIKNNKKEELACLQVDSRGSPGLAKGPKGMFRMILT